MEVGKPHFVENLTGCARCNGDGHDNITFQPLTHSIPFEDGYVATHWAPCPTNGEPILNGDGAYPGWPVRKAAWAVLEAAENSPADTIPAPVHDALLVLRKSFLGNDDEFGPEVTLDEQGKGGESK